MPKKKKKLRKKQSKKHRQGSPAQSGSQSTSSSGGGGTMMSMRSGFQGLLGQKSSKKPKSTAQKIWDVLFWLVLAGAVGFFIYRRFIAP